MTLAALLEELKAVDYYTYRKLSFLVPCIGFDANIDNDEYDQDIVQGCLQRACERRGWRWLLENGDIAITENMFRSDIFDSEYNALAIAIEGKTPAEALLAAYIAAVRGEEEAKR